MSIEWSEDECKCGNLLRIQDNPNVQLTITELETGKMHHIKGVGYCSYCDRVVFMEDTAEKGTSTDEVKL